MAGMAIAYWPDIKSGSTPANIMVNRRRIVARIPPLELRMKKILVVEDDDLPDEGPAVTAGGKVKFKKQGLRHILTKKSTKRKRRLRHSAVLSDPETRRVKRMLPYA